MSEARAKSIRGGDPQVRKVLQNLRALIDGLRQDGVPLDPTHELLVQEVGLELLRREEPLSSATLKAHLKPVLCSSVFDDAAFERRWALLTGTAGNMPEGPRVQSDQKTEADRARRRLQRARWKGIWLGAAGLALVGALCLVLTHRNTAPLPGNPPPEAAQPVEIPGEFTKEAVFVPEEKAAPGDVAQPKSAPQSVVPLPVAVDWSPEGYPPEDLFPRWVTPDRRPAWIAAGLAGLGLLGLILFFGRFAESLHLRRGRPGPDDHPEKLWLDLERPERHLGHLLKSVAHRLRQHEAVAAQGWDPLLTIQKTIRSGGILHPVRASRPESPEYLAFVQHWHRQDHWQQLGHEWLEALRSRGVAVRAVGFDHHPGQAWWPETSSPVTLRELHARFPRHRILVLGEDLETSSSFSGKRHPWINDLSDWETARIILTPPGEETDEWVREMREVDDWLVVPLAPEGLDRLAAWLGGDNSSGRAARSPGARVPATFVANEKAWLSPRQPSKALIANGILELEGWLGAHGMAWLRACAVYPDLNWQLTQYLGLGLERRTNGARSKEEDEAVLWKLSQLPWFRKGRMPSWWRSSLLDGFSSAEKEYVRSLLLSAMVRDGAGKRLYSLDYVARNPRRVGWRGRWQVRNVRGPARKRLEEAVCARVLGDRFSVKLPLLGERRIPVLLIGSLVLLAGAAAVALPNWKSFIPDSRAPFPYITAYELPRDPDSPRDVRRSWTLRHPSGIVFRWAPPGSFRMGEPEVQGRRVELTHGFWIATTEVTERQWLRTAESWSMAEYLADYFEWKDLIDGYFWQMAGSALAAAWQDLQLGKEQGALPHPATFQEANAASGELIQPDQQDPFAFASMEQQFSLGEDQIGKGTCIALDSGDRPAAMGDIGILAIGAEDGSLKLWTVTGDEMASLKEHSGAITALAWSSEDKYLASASRDGAVKLWDGANYEVKATLSGHQTEVTSLAFGFEGSREILASGAGDGTVKLWEPDSGKELAALSGHTAEVTSLLWLDETLVSGSMDGTVRVWSVRGRREKGALRGSGAPVMSLSLGAWDSDHEFVIAAGSKDGRVTIWDSEKQNKITSFDVPGGGVISLCFLGEEASILVAGASDGTLSFWDSASGEPRKALKLGSGLRGMLAIDSITLAAASANGVEVWNAMQPWISRLPTEAQWEYALRAGLEVPDANIRPNSGWNRDNSGGRAHPVATKPPNPWGLYDMSGNLQEWCRDWFEPLVPGDNVVDPTGIASIFDAHKQKVLRGGAYLLEPAAMLAHSRAGREPFQTSFDAGFRPVIVPQSDRDLELESTFDRVASEYQFQVSKEELLKRYEGVEIPQGYKNLHPLQVADAAIDHIIKFETGDRAYYEQHYQRPTWWGYASGVTVGIAYDLGYHTADEIRKDWAGVASEAEIQAMVSVVGVTGSRAEYLAKEIQDKVHISWEEGRDVFERITLPEWNSKTSKAYRFGRGDLHPLCCGALIGNTFNRGDAINPEGRTREKYLIREAIRKENYLVIPGLLREQRKYWPGTSGPSGPLQLQTRRSEEAELFEMGLVAMLRGPWPLPSFATDDMRSPTGRTYGRNDIVGANHPIWTNGELHPGLIERKDRILGIGREGEHCHRIRAGVLYAVSAAAYQANALGYQFYITSGNRWGVSTSPNHSQNADIGDSVDFVVTTGPGGTGDRVPATPEGMKATYDILAAAVVAGANGIGWGRANGAGHHVEVDDAQRGDPDVADVWPYTDESDPVFQAFEQDFANQLIQTNPAYAQFREFTYHGAEPKGVAPIPYSPAPGNEVPDTERDPEPAVVAFPEEAPSSMPANRADAEVQLDKTYQLALQELALPQVAEFGDVQKAWFAYRDAAKAVVQSIDPAGMDATLVQITGNRIHDLERMLAFLDKPEPIPVSESGAATQATELEAKLGDLFNQVRLAAQETVKKTLEAEQRTWTAYRDLQVALVRGLSNQEPLRLILHYRERVAMARQRIRLLAEWKAKLPALPTPRPEPEPSQAPAPVPPPAAATAAGSPKAAEPTPAPMPAAPPAPAQAPAAVPASPQKVSSQTERDYVNVRPLRVGRKALEHLLRFETGGRAFFESNKNDRPWWPGYASGVTVGFGYDLGYHGKDEISRDWEGIASKEEIAAMLRAQGVTGPKAQNLAALIRPAVQIDWNEALLAFERASLPEWADKTSQMYEFGRGDLHPLCNGALIGNTFNRGTSMSPDGRNREKWLIREAIRKEDYSVIPMLLREQRKYWPGTSGDNGLQTRRSEEADLFQQGLDAMKQGPWPPPGYAEDDGRSASGQTYGRNDIVGVNHPIWSNGELHPGLTERKQRILGIGREGKHCHRIRAGVLYAATAAAYQANALGYHFYVTSGNRWGVSNSSIHGQDGAVGDSVDFIITTAPEGGGNPVASDAKGMQDTYDILAAAAVAGANGIGWGRARSTSHHVEVDDPARGAPGPEDVWPYSDDRSAAFLRFEKNYGSGAILKAPQYAKFRNFVYRGPDPKGITPQKSSGQEREIADDEEALEDARDASQRK